jgi:hypothetical protein
LVPLSRPGFAAQKTWTGQISDRMCGVHHGAMSSGGKTVDACDCTLMCTKQGARLVFVSDGKVFDIFNQSFTDLTKHAGHAVRVTGDLVSDGKAITLSKFRNH